MLSSPRRPDSTMRIFSSAENCRRVARRIALITCSAGSFTGPDFCPIFAPSMATMGQKSSLPQLAPSVSQALMPDMADRLHLSQGDWLGLVLPVERARRLLPLHRRLEAVHYNEGRGRHRHARPSAADLGFARGHAGTAAQAPVRQRFELYRGRPGQMAR